jgi:hypothetical protein
MANDLMTIGIIGVGIALAGAGFFHLLSIDDSPNLTINSTTAPPATMWPMQREDPNITNAYNRAKYKDNTLRANELYTNTQSNYTNDFLSTYAPTVKQMNIPVQQL